MPHEEFDQKAQQLLVKLSSLSALRGCKRIDSSSAIKTSQNLGELQRFLQDVEHTQEDNKKKIKTLHENIYKLEAYLLQENESRNKMSEEYVANTLKVKKNLHAAITSIHTQFADKEKKLQQKIDCLLKEEKKDLENKLQETENLCTSVNRLAPKMNEINTEILQMRKKRSELQEKIQKQFQNQIRELRKMFEKDIKEREAKEVQMLEQLKDMYKNTMNRIKNETAEREAHEKMFLEVIEQLIRRVTD